MKKLLVLIVSGIIIQLFACDPKSTCRDNYQFIIPLSISAKSDTIQIGDSIFVNIRFTRRLYNPFTSNMVNVPANFFVHSLYINKIIKDSTDIYNTNSLGAWNNFDYDTLIGSLLHQFYNWSMDINYVQKYDSLMSKFVFIAKDTGTYIFSITDKYYFSICTEDLKDYGLNSDINNCDDYWLHSLFENHSISNNYIIDKRHICINTKYYYYTESITDGKTNSVKDFTKNLHDGSFCVVVK